MNSNHVDITILLDKSGSMSSVRAATVEGLNAFIADQKNQPGHATLSLVQFDEAQSRVINTFTADGRFGPINPICETTIAAQPISSVVPLTLADFVPRGGTPLLDAIGQTMESTGQRLSATPEYARPGKVLFVIVTDGEENSSTRFSRSQIFDLIGRQKSVYNWQFIFLGANQDAIQAGASLNIGAGNSMKYAHSAVGTKSAFASTSGSAANYRCGGTAEFTAEDRDAQKKAGA